MFYVLQFCRYFVGILFIVSGLIKLNDPVGTQIKLEEYFEVLHIPFFIPFALFISVIICSLEVVLGVALLLLYRLRITMVVLLGLILFFTFLTFYSAYFNKVTDCGCFGDAIKLKPWESFTKDVVLLIMILILFISEKKFKPRFDHLAGDVLVGLATLLSVGFAVYCIRNLSVIDFRAYKVGVNIKQGMILPPGAKASIYQSFITLRKEGTGETKKISDKAYIDSGIWQDTTWKYIERSEPVLVQKGDEPTIKDFKITGEENQDITDTLLNGNWLLFLYVHTEEAPKEPATAFIKLANALANSGIRSVVVTSSARQAIEEYRHDTQLAVPYAFADEKVIKTIIRSNPGIVLLKNGVVTAKWHYHNTPTTEEVINLTKR